MAAMAFLMGQDPIRFLAYEGAERQIADVVLKRAWTLHVETVKARAAGGLFG